MNILAETKATIIKGKSKSGNDYYAIKVYLTKDYATFIILQNADRELVKNTLDKQPEVQEFISNE